MHLVYPMKEGGKARNRRLKPERVKEDHKTKKNDNFSEDDR